MKLDKIKFANVLAYVAGIMQRQSIDSTDITVLDDLIDIDVPTPNTAYPTASDISQLMFLMQQGTQKIEAIKLHRKLTGWGLKESKDEVEKYWRSKPVEKESATLGDILRNAK